MKFKEGMNIEEKLSALQRIVLVHSNIYYRLNKNIISDKEYDTLCKLLVSRQNKYKESFKDTDYYYVFYDFDGTTGFDLYYRLKKKDRDKINNITQVILKRKGEK